MFRDPRAAVRYRAAVAALHARDRDLLASALAEVTARRSAGVVDDIFGDQFDPEVLYELRGSVGEWVGSAGSDVLVEAIALRGSGRWVTWFEQLAATGKVSLARAVGAALACDGRIPEWTRPHLLNVAATAAYWFRAAAARGTNLELARWVAQHYEEARGDKGGGLFHLNKVLVSCGDDSTFQGLLDRFPSMSPEAQEYLSFAIAEKGDPWLGRFQTLAFSGDVDGRHHELFTHVSKVVDDATARSWTQKEVAALGWRTLIARHGNKIVPELVRALPLSFDGIGAVPVLEAMRDLDDPPESLADEIWLRIRGTMEPRTMDEAISALARVRTRGIPSLIGALIRNPFFLPSFHLTRFFLLLAKWQTETGTSIRVRDATADRDFVEWLFRNRALRDKDDDLFRSRLRTVPDLVVPALIGFFDDEPALCWELIVLAGKVRSYHAGLVAYAMSDPTRTLSVPKIFAPAFDTFPEEILLRLLDELKGTSLREFVAALSTTSNPLHARLHVALAKLAVSAKPTEPTRREVARVMRTHPRTALLSLLKQVATSRTDDEIAFVREVELSTGQLLLTEDGHWLDEEPALPRRPAPTGSADEGRRPPEPPRDSLWRVFLVLVAAVILLTAASMVHGGFQTIQEAVLVSFVGLVAAVVCFGYLRSSARFEHTSNGAKLVASGAVVSLVLVFGCFITYERHRTADVQRADAPDGPSTASAPSRTIELPTLSGIVTDPDNRGVSGVEIIALETGDRTRTTSDGQFFLRGVPAGRVTLHLSRAGFVVRDVLVTSPSPSVLALTLEPTPPPKPPAVAGPRSGVTQHAVGQGAVNVLGDRNVVIVNGGHGNDLDASVLH